MSGYFGMLPPELMRGILDELKLPAMVALMKCSKNLHAYVEPEIFLHKFARDAAMDWGIRKGQLNVIRRLVETFGASPSFYGGTILTASLQQQPATFSNSDRYECVYPRSTLLAVLKNAPDIEEALRVFNDLGAVLDPALCTRSKRDIEEVTFVEGDLYSAWYEQMHSFARRMVAMPTKTEKQRKGKLAALRYYYDTGYESFIANWGARPGARPNIVCSLPRLIRSDDDLPIVKFILDQEGISEVKGNKVEEQGNGNKVGGDDKAMLDDERPDRDETMVDQEMTKTTEEIQGRSSKGGQTRNEAEKAEDEKEENEKKEDEAKMEDGETTLSFPMVDRPERCGPNGAPISPLSAAVLCDARKVFDLLIEHGAEINGPKLDFKKHGPTTHALHIPIFAAAHVLARRKTNTTGIYWIGRCIAAGADINHMALCKLSGKHRPYRPVSDSLGYYAQGMSYPPNGNVYFWATPIDVFVDCLSLRYLRQRVRIQDDGFSGNDIVHSADTNMDVFLQNDAYVDLASKRAPPRPLDDNVWDTLRAGKSEESGPQRDDPMYPGEPTDSAFDTWRNWKRVVSPVTLEILLDRMTVSGMAHPVAYSYAEFLRSIFESSLGQAGRLMSKYDGPAPESRFPSWTSGAEAVGRRTLAMLLLCDDESAMQSIELHRYIVYAVRRADMLFMDKVIDNIEQVFSGPTSHIDVEGPYTPSKADDDVEYQYFLLTGGRDPRINRAQSARPTRSWTALHEICRLWNLQMIAYDKGRDNPRYPVPRFARQIQTTMKLLMTLLTHGFPLHQEANGMTPRDVLLQNPDSVLRTESMLLLEVIADYMMKTKALLDLAIKG